MEHTYILVSVDEFLEFVLYVSIVSECFSKGLVNNSPDDTQAEYKYHPLPTHPALTVSDRSIANIKYKLHPPCFQTKTLKERASRKYLSTKYQKVSEETVI